MPTSPDSSLRLPPPARLCAAVWIALAALWSVPGPALAQAGPRVTGRPTPEYVFGEAVTFRLRAAGSADIIDVTLLVSTPDQPRTYVGKARFVRSRNVEATYVLEPDRRRIAPFAPVTYWWEVTDSAGNLLVTERQTFTYADNRHTWQTLTDGRITVAWYEGDRAFGQAALDIAAEGLVRANRDIQAPLPDAVTVYVYADLAEARVALSPADRLWADGHANPLFGVAVVTLPPDDVDTLTRMAREIPHELTHILIAEKAGDRFDDVPAWLNEGLAMMSEATPDPDAPAVLDEARAADALIPLERLCGPFPDDPAQARLSYAQSESVVRYLGDRYGSRSLSALLEAYADGLDCDSGVRRALGLSLDDLERGWLQDKVHANPATLQLRLLAPWLILIALVLLTLIVFLLLTLIRLSRRAQPVV